MLYFTTDWIRSPFLCDPGKCFQYFSPALLVPGQTLSSLRAYQRQEPTNRTQTTMSLGLARAMLTRTSYFFKFSCGEVFISMRNLKRTWSKCCF